jgi:hypothetical protein
MFGRRSKRYDSCNWGATNGYTDGFSGERRRPIDRDLNQTTAIN